MARPDSFRYLLLSLLVGLQLTTSDGAVPVIGTVIKFATTTKDVAELGTTIWGYIRGTDNGDDLSNEDLKTSIDRSIQAAKTEVIVSMMALSRLGDIEDAVMRVSSSMKDLQKIIQATDPDVYEKYKDEFVMNYENNNVALHVRNLASLLTYQGPGQQFQLLQHIVDTNRCSITGLLDFAEYYLNLVSEGIALHMIYDFLTKQFPPERVIEDEWGDGLKKIQDDLEDAFKGCMDKFWNLAQEDVRITPSAQVLAENSAKRYIFHWTDAMFYAPVGTYQFHYRKHIQKKLAFYHADDQNKIGVFGRLATAPDSALISQIESSLEDAEFTVPASDNEQAATNVGRAVEEHVTDMGHSIEAIVVYFDGGDFKEKGTYKHDNSNVATYTMTGVSLDYCFDWSLVCFFKGGGDTASGSFKVFVYATRGSGGQGDDYTVGGAGTNRLCTMTYAMAALLLALRYFIS